MTQMIIFLWVYAKFKYSNSFEHGITHVFICWTALRDQQPAHYSARIFQFPCSDGFSNPVLAPILSWICPALRLGQCPTCLLLQSTGNVVVGSVRALVFCWLTGTPCLYGLPLSGIPAASANMTGFQHTCTFITIMLQCLKQNRSNTFSNIMEINM